MTANYQIQDYGRRLPAGAPCKDEFYGSYWVIDNGLPNGDVLVHDPGDGSAESLAKAIVEFLNGRRPAL